MHYLQELGYGNAEGVDISDEQIVAAGKLGVSNVVNSDVAEFIADKKGIYEIVFARDVLEHFTKQEVLDVLDLVYSSLSPSGRLVLQVPNGGSPFFGRIRYGDFTHEQAFTSTSLNQILLSAGFRSIECYPVRPVPKGVKSFIRYVLWVGIESVIRFCSTIETGNFRGIFTQNIIAVAAK